MSVSLKPPRLAPLRKSPASYSGGHKNTSGLAERIEETVNSTILLCSNPSTSGDQPDVPDSPRPLVIVETLPPKKRKKAYTRHSSQDRTVAAVVGTNGLLTVNSAVLIKPEPAEELNGFNVDATPLPVVINDCDGRRLKGSPDTNGGADEVPLDFSLRSRRTGDSRSNTVTTVTTTKASRPSAITTDSSSTRSRPPPFQPDLYSSLLTIPPLYPISVAPPGSIPSSFAYPPGLYPGFSLFPYFDTKLFGDLSALLKGSELSQKTTTTVESEVVPRVKVEPSAPVSAQSILEENEREEDEEEINVEENSEESDGNPIGDEEDFFINPITGNRVRRNYKNMTRERRVEANARERTRVHTIGAAFDRLRRLVPSYSPDQKLSKLSILRIACSYIMLLAAMNDRDYSLDQRGYSVSECADLLSNTILQETKYKAK